MSMPKEKKLEGVLKEIIESFRFIILEGTITNYIISRNGIVINTKTGKIIKQFRCSYGRYNAIHINVNGKNYKRMVHRLVAQAFIPNPENKPQVNHKDSNTFNNWDWNLEWVTIKENVHHMIQVGHQVVGIKHVNCKSSEKQIHEACKMLENNKIPLSKISKKTGLSIKTISNIKNRNGWKHISKNYKIDHDKRNRGAKYSKESLYIIGLIKRGMNNSEIIQELNLSGMGSGLSRKSISDRIYHIRKCLN